MYAMIKNIVLIGFMGSGKTTIGKILAKTLGYDFIDTDELVVKNEGMSIPEIFENKGQEYFRQLETAALKEAMALEGVIVSTGGGIVTIKDNEAILAKGTVIYLEASPDQIYKNVKGDRSRPLLQGEDVYQKICTMLKEREVLYKSLAHHIVTVDGKTPQEICTLILGGIQ